MNPNNPDNNPPAVPPEATVIDPGYSYEDLQKENLRDIATNSEPPKAPEDEEPEVKPVTPEVPTPPEVTPEPVDVEEVAKKAAEAAAAKVLEDQQKLEDEAKPKVSEAEQFRADFEAKEGRQPNWEEVAEFFSNKAVERLEAKQAEQARLAQEQQDQAKATEQSNLERFNKIVDEQLNDLYASNKLTKVVDPKNPSDQGVVERQALFQAMYDVNIARSKEGKDPIYSLKEIYYEHYTRPQAQPAGGDAPISPSRGSSDTPQDQELDYARDIAGKPWSFFKRG
jgi:hypothetical protein